MPSSVGNSRHTALYRKYRPSVWGEVLGQEHVVKTLESAIQGGAIAHAYLFSGTRGTGKTSIARIFARAIGSAGTDVYEIDAASNRGIDDVRELRESVKTVPFESKYKVYIIDEAHMLTKEAFNALLKTLEEPPPHAIFILATTEPHKLPETVVSRCQHFTFKKPPRETLAGLLEEVAKREGRILDPAAAGTIALLGDGSFRDALVALQKIFLLSPGKTISAEDVERLAGLPKNSLVNDFLKGLLEGDASRAILSLRSAEEANMQHGVFAKLALAKLRAAMLLRLAPDLAPALEGEFTAEDFAFLKELSRENPARLRVTLSLLLDASTKIPHSFISELPLELAAAKLCEEALQ